jgi:hypothetical protein
MRETVRRPASSLSRYRGRMRLSPRREARFRLFPSPETDILGGSSRWTWSFSPPTRKNQQTRSLGPARSRVVRGEPLGRRWQLQLSRRDLTLKW